MELNYNPSFTVGVGLREGCVLSQLLVIVDVKWMDSHSLVDEGGTAGSCRISSFFFTGDLVGNCLHPLNRVFNTHLIGFQLRAAK